MAAAKQLFWNNTRDIFWELSIIIYKGIRFSWDDRSEKMNIQLYPYLDLPEGLGVLHKLHHPRLPASGHTAESDKILITGMFY